MCKFEDLPASEQFKRVVLITLCEANLHGLYPITMYAPDDSGKLTRVPTIWGGDKLTGFFLERDVERLVLPILEALTEKSFKLFDTTETQTIWHREDYQESKEQT